MTNEEALREFLLELLVTMQKALLATEEGREQARTTFAWQVEHAHPAVAAVLREAAERVMDA
ncbi:hypothetical protein A7A09_019845 [Paracoccus methylarcula]|uniref:Uncharacterized protein n=2 Tax=Paracoccus methylarcula TaxID=72022 RepID=A0A422QSA6_9RHOB|nr:hypothetical protein A7A09_019845 [Paracoccus methylarcula]